jgi:anti-anti-sigma factor
MAHKIKPSEEEVLRFSIEGEMTASMVDELREAIFPVIAISRKIEIDLSRVSEIDFAGVGLLMEAKLEANALDRELHFIGYSQPVVEMLALCDSGEYWNRVGINPCPPYQIRGRFSALLDV